MNGHERWRPLVAEVALFDAILVSENLVDKCLVQGQSTSRRRRFERRPMDNMLGLYALEGDSG